ncbi:unnamed protein product, partial [Ilex paraguariensis]
SLKNSKTPPDNDGINEQGRQISCQKTSVFGQVSPRCPNASSMPLTLTTSNRHWSALRTHSLMLTNIGTVNLKARKTEILLKDECANDARFEFEKFMTEIAALILLEYN